MIKHSNVDFYVELEGEMGFSNLIENLIKFDFDIKKLKAHEFRIDNTSYVNNGKYIFGDLNRILDINLIPSPYLLGFLDQFFDLPLIPMMESLLKKE
jgi:hypothetical protein